MNGTTRAEIRHVREKVANLIILNEDFVMEIAQPYQPMYELITLCMKIANVALKTPNLGESEIVSLGLEFFNNDRC